MAAERRWVSVLDMPRAVYAVPCFFPSFTNRFGPSIVWHLCAFQTYGVWAIGQFWGASKSHQKKSSTFVGASWSHSLLFMTPLMSPPPGASSMAR